MLDSTPIRQMLTGWAMDVFLMRLFSKLHGTCADDGTIAGEAREAVAEVLVNFNEEQNQHTSPILPENRAFVSSFIGYPNDFNHS